MIRIEEMSVLLGITSAFLRTKKERAVCAPRLQAEWVPVSRPESALLKWACGRTPNRRPLLLNARRPGLGPARGGLRPDSTVRQRCRFVLCGTARYAPGNK